MPNTKMSRGEPNAPKTPPQGSERKGAEVGLELKPFPAQASPEPLLEAELRSSGPFPLNLQVTSPQEPQLPTPEEVQDRLPPQSEPLSLSGRVKAFMQRLEEARGKEEEAKDQGEVARVHKEQEAGGKEEKLANAKMVSDIYQTVVRIEKAQQNYYEAIKTMLGQLLMRK